MNKNNAKDLSLFHSRLQAWYRVHGRHGLPWRHTHDPYAVYVSEIMLQQTQVQTVLARYYHPFLKRFPTLESLAAAAERDVLKAWEGLGYYTRARNLHRAAKQTGTALPADAESLMALPGIGRNTAHAVAAFGFGAKVPVMEANVRRVLCRIFALEKASEKELWQRAESLLNRAHAFNYNQAVMDLGALICTPKSPRCEACPAAVMCKGKANPLTYPIPRAAKATPTRRQTVVLLQAKNGALHATPRDTRFLHGMYRFIELPGGSNSLRHGRNRYALSEHTRLGCVTHAYSHFTLDAEVHAVQSNLAGRGAQWVAPQTLHALPFSAAEHKMLVLLKEKA